MPFVHERHEVVAHPGDGRELATVGDLVEGEPETELARLEAVELLEGHHVRADEVHEVLVLDGLLGEEEVVLTEHPGGEPTEDHAHLCAGGGPPGRGQRPGQPLGQRVAGGDAGGVQLLQVGPDEALEAGHVGMDPSRPVGDPGPGRARRRAQAGRRRHQLLGLGGELLEIGLEQVGPVRGGEATPVPHPAGHPLGGFPSHRPAGVGRTSGVGHGDQCRDRRHSSAGGRQRELRRGLARTINASGA